VCDGLEFLNSARHLTRTMLLSTFIMWYTCVL